MFPVCTHSAFLHTLRDHHHVVDILFPDHLPEIIFSSWQWTLCGDVLPAKIIALKKTKGDIHPEEDLQHGAVLCAAIVLHCLLPSSLLVYAVMIDFNVQQNTEESLC